MAINQYAEVLKIVRSVPEKEWHDDPELCGELFGASAEAGAGAVMEEEDGGLKMGFHKSAADGYPVPAYEFAMQMEDPACPSAMMSFDLTVKCPLWPFGARAALYSFFSGICERLEREREDLKRREGGEILATALRLIATKGKEGWE